MATREEYLLGIDSSTQSTKACVWSPSGRLIAKAASNIRVESPRTGWAEQDPNRWWSSTRSAIRKVLRQVGSERIAAIGLAYQRETFALLGRAGEALRPAILWLDVRAEAEVKEVEKLVGREGYHNTTGKPLDVTSALPRLLWLRRHEPESVKGAARWADVGSYLSHRLTGEYRTCVAGTDTCGLIGLKSRDWEGPYLDLAGLGREQLPELVEPGDVIGRIAPGAARQTGLPEGLPVVAAGGDGQVFSVGMNAVAPFSVTLTLGTSIVLGISCADAPVSPLFRTLISASSGYVLECVLQSGTYLLRWFVETCAGSRRRNEAYWEQKVKDIAPGCEGLMTVPNWWGVRFPESLPDARGATIGWSNHHTFAHFYRSLLEGLAFELSRAVGELERTFPDRLERAIRTGGGGARSEVWIQILADVLNRPMSVNRQDEVTALGAAILAGVGVGILDDVASAAGEMVALKNAREPAPESAQLYCELFERCYLPLFESAKPVSKELRRITNA